MDLSQLTIREIFAQLTAVEDALQGRTEKRLTASRRRLLELHQDRLCEELHSRVPGDDLTVEPTKRPPTARTVPA